MRNLHIVPSHNIATGSFGEQIAAQFLSQQGFAIIDRNARSRWGELDIIARKNEKIYFVEVKTRKGQKGGKAFENVHLTKLRHLARTIQHYLKIHDLYHYKTQLDVVTVDLTDLSHPIVKRYENLEISV